MFRSRAAFSCISRLILSRTLTPKQHPRFAPPIPPPLIPPTSFRHSFLHQARHFSAQGSDSDSESELPDPEDVDRAIQALLGEVEREKLREREEKRKAGLIVNEEEEEQEDFMGVGPLIEKIDKKIAVIDAGHSRWRDDDFDEDSDSESEEDDDDEERAEQMSQKEEMLIRRKLKRHDELIKEFVKTDNLEDAFKMMKKIDKFEEKHFRVRPEYRVIGELINRFKDATGKDKFLLAQKLNRAFRLVQQREAFDPNNPAHYSVIQREEVGASEEAKEDADAELTRDTTGETLDDEEDEFDDMKERDDILLEKLSAIDKKLEEKLEALDYTFGKKGKVLEEEIRDLAEERNSLTEKKTIPMFRKGFDVHLIDMNRTCKVTKGGQVVKYTAILACGNYNGVVGYAKAKGPAVPIALQKAYEKCFQNLHTVDRYEDHTIAHAVQTTYKKTKVYLWPAKTTTGMKAGRTVQTILNLAGFKNVKSKVIGSRNPHNTVKAVFQALNAIETPKDVQEKLGRTVVESYLL